MDDMSCFRDPECLGADFSARVLKTDRVVTLVAM